MLSLPDTQITAESTEAMQIKCLAHTIQLLVSCCAVFYFVLSHYYFKFVKISMLFECVKFPNKCCVYFSFISKRGDMIVSYVVFFLPFTKILNKSSALVFQ